MDDSVLKPRSPFLSIYGEYTAVKNLRTERLHCQVLKCAKLGEHGGHSAFPGVEAGLSCSEVLTQVQGMHTSVGGGGNREM